MNTDDAIDRLQAFLDDEVGWNDYRGAWVFAGRRAQRRLRSAARARIEIDTMRDLPLYFCGLPVRDMKNLGDDEVVVFTRDPDLTPKYASPTPPPFRVEIEE